MLKHILQLEIRPLQHFNTIVINTLAISMVDRDNCSNQLLKIFSPEFQHLSEYKIYNIFICNK